MARRASESQYWAPLSLEMLESRRMLAMWDGGGGNSDWNDELNWVGDVLPGPSDDVDIPDLGGANTVDIAGAVVNVNSITSAAKLSVAAGATVSIVQHSSLWGGLDILGDCTFDALPGVDLGGASEWSAPTEINAVLYNYGIMTIVGNISGTTVAGGLYNVSGTLVVEGGPLLNTDIINDSTGLVLLSTDVTGTAQVYNQGNFASSGAVELGSAIELNNVGTITASNGTLTLSGTVDQFVGGTLTDGIWNLGDGTILFPGTTRVSINEGTVEIGGRDADSREFGQLADNRFMLSLAGDGTGLITTGDLTSSGIVGIAGGTTLGVGATPTLDLVGQWHAEGNAYDAASDNDGALLYGATYAAGRVGEAFSFDGVDDEVEFTAFEGSSLTDFTLATWVYIDPITNTGERRVLSWDDYPSLGADGIRETIVIKSSSPAWGGANAGEGRPSFGILRGATFDRFSAPSALTAGWHHLAGTRSGTTLTLYVDGVSQGTLTSALTGPLSPESPLAFGRSATGTAEPFAGRIDEVVVYSSALTAGQIAAMMAGGVYTQTGGASTVMGTLVADSVTVEGGTIRGSGAINADVSNGATFAPGTSPGRITINGDYAQTVGGTLEIEIAGTTAATEYDTLRVNGAVSLAGSLDVIQLGGFDPTFGDAFTIIENDGADPVSGTFAGLAEGAMIVFGTGTLVISYSGGTGNDVVLTASPGTLTVTHTADSGTGSLRQAIIDSNWLAGMQTIEFDIPGPGPHTIAPTSSLPSITDAVVIDGYSQPGSSINTLSASDNAVLMIELSGTSAGAGASGLVIAEGPSVIRGLAINGFELDGIQISGVWATGTVITGNFIGTSVDGTSALANGDAGVRITDGATGNRIGTDGDGVDDLGERNVIAGNANQGVIITGSGTRYNVVAGNYVGIKADGSAALPNGQSGVAIVASATDNRIGTDGSNDLFNINERNIISGNTREGVLIGSSGSDRNIVAGNYIGLDPTGTLAIGNVRDGVFVDNAAYNRIGTDRNGVADADERNVISANASTANVYVQNAAWTTVQGNFVGTRADGGSTLTNTRDGIQVWNATNTAVRDNVSSGNVNGLVISGGSTSGTRVEGNIIGLDVTGTIDLGNTAFGIWCVYAANTIIGGGTATSGNVISGNANTGIQIEGGASNVIVAGNFVGTNAGGTAAIANDQHGIRIRGGASQVRIGTDGDGLNDVLERNVIAGNANDGIRIEGPGTDGNIVAGNFIGVDATGLAALGNLANGIDVRDGPTNTRIGTDGSNDGFNVNERNIISGSGYVGMNPDTGGMGIHIYGNATFDTVIAGNYVGTDVTGLTAIPNHGAYGGVAASTGASNIRIGTDGDGIADDAEGNLIAGNTGYGVLLFGTTYVDIAGNRIGVNATGMVALANGASGISVLGGAVETRIGTNADGVSDALERNVISGNAQDGVSLGHNGTDANIIWGNYIGPHALGSGTPAPSGAVSWWMAEGNASDAIGTNTGSVVGGVTYAGGASDGTGFQFDGSTGHISVPDSATIIPTAVITIDAWFSATSTGSFQSLVSKFNHLNATTDDSFYLAITDTGNLRWQLDTLGTGDNILDAVPTSNLFDGQYHHAAATYDSTTMRLFLDGAEVGSRLASGTIQDVALPVLFGASLVNGTNGLFLNGRLDDVGIYDRALTSTEINRIYAMRGAGKGAGNGGNGVVVSDGASETIIGGFIAGSRNVISGNWGDGIEVSDSHNNVIAGNYIGLNVAGTGRVGNSQNGILVQNTASGNLIGTDGDGLNDAAERNVVSGNAGGVNANVNIIGAGTMNNVVAGNYIGTNAAGTTGLTNPGRGVRIASGASFNRIGTDGSNDAFNASERNVISGHTSIAVFIPGSSNDNVVAGNYIGLDATGTVSIGNADQGIGIDLSHRTRIGTNADGIADAEEANVVAGSATFGILIANYSTLNTVAGNRVGTNAAGTAALPNAYGVALGHGSTNNTIGGSTASSGNLVSGNAGPGVWVLRTFNATTYDPSPNNVIQGNWIGTDVTGTIDLGNLGDGFRVEEPNTTVGGLTPLARNVVSGNDGNGILVTGAPATGNVIQGNYIGTDYTGTSAVPNAGAGVMINQGAHDNTIGGIAGGEANRITHNGQAGVILADSVAATSTIRGNSIHDNGGLAIDVGATGLTLNDPGDTDGYLNFPVITSAVMIGDQLEVSGYVGAGVTIDFYETNSSASEFGEANRYLLTRDEGSAADIDPGIVSYGPGPVGGRVVGSDTANRFKFTFAVPPGLGLGSVITAGAVGSTSELSGNIEITPPASNGSPIVTLGADTQVTPGELFQTSGSFTDADSTSWSATVDYGDGSGPQPLAIAADKTFLLSHTFAVSGTFVVTVTVIDDGGAAGTDGLTVVATNEAPETQYSGFQIDGIVSEGGTITLSGAFSDSGLLDTHTIRIEWGDGIVTSLTSADVVDRTFTTTHTYEDDGESRTSTDVYQVQLAVIDNFGAYNETPLGLFMVEVQNVAPSNLTLLTDYSTINEYGAVTVAGSFDDPGLLDTHRITIDWGDGSQPTILQDGFGYYGGHYTRLFGTPAHTYTDNPPEGVTSYTITVEVVDDDEPETPIRATRTVAVTNVTPHHVVVSASPAAIDEGGVTTISGSFVDEGLADTHSLFIDWGDDTTDIVPVTPGERTFAGIDHRYLDDPPQLGFQTYEIRVRVVDDDSLIPGSPPSVYGEGRDYVSVNNVAPALTGLTLTRDGVIMDSGDWLSEGDVVVLSGTYVDPGVNDRHTVSIDWHDGTPIQVVDVDTMLSTFQAIHQIADDDPTATSTDAMTFDVTITDDEGGVGTASMTRSVANVAPEVTIVTGDQSSVGNVHLVAQVLDPSLSDTFRFQWSAVPASTGYQPVPPFASDFGTARLSHYLFPREAGAAYTITLIVEDDDLGFISREFFFIGGTDAPNAIAIEDSVSGGIRVTIDGTTSDYNLPTTTRIVVYGGEAQDTINASDTTRPLVLDGGMGTDYLFGGSGDDLFVLHGGDDQANVADPNNPDAPAVINTAGNDQYLLVPNSDLIVFDDSGLNAINFNLADFGIQFDLNALGTRQDVAYGSGTSGEPVPSTGEHFVTATGLFYELAGSRFGDLLTATSGTRILSGEGADKLLVTSGTTDVFLSGGADADEFLATGTNIFNIVFSGDDGSDRFLNDASTVISGLTFVGGADDDVFQNFGSLSGNIIFQGDDGFDVFVNTSAAVLDGLTFVGGADDDVFQNFGNIAGTIVFQGDDGSDSFVNHVVDIVGSLTFVGGADDDVFQNFGSLSGTIVFQGDDGNDVFVNSGTSVIDGLTFIGGADDDVFENFGNVGATIVFQGDDGADSFVNDTAGVVGGITFTGGADDDVFQNFGNVTGDMVFQGDDGADRFLNSGGVVEITFTGGADDDVFVNQTNAMIGGLTFTGGADDDLFQNFGNVSGGIVFQGDDGADRFLNDAAGVVGGITFNGGADDDVFVNQGRVGLGITFSGDDGADAFQNLGSVSGNIVFQGDDGADTFLNAGGVVGITFTGGADDDVFVNQTSATVGGLTFTGGADDDVFQNFGTVSGNIVFQGDDGADTFLNAGGVVGITFTGGADDDVFENRASDIRDIVFNGDDGADSFLNTGGVVGITFTGGADDDVFVNQGQVGQGIAFQGDDGADRFLNAGGVLEITFTGGADDDVFVNQGQVGQGIVFQGDDGADSFLNVGGVVGITFTGGADDDVFENRASDILDIVFNGDDGADAFLNAGSDIASITFVGGADDDVFVNAGSTATTLVFIGDDEAGSATTGGSDILINHASGIAIDATQPSIKFIGGADYDAFQNNGHDFALIQFGGDSGDDVFQNNGGAIGNIVFSGDDGADVFENNGVNIGVIDFRGDAGADAFINDGALVTTIVFTGDTGDDAFLNTGNTIGSIEFSGDDGADVFQNDGIGVGSIVFTGDDGADVLVNHGSNVGSIDFSGDLDSDAFLNTGTAIGSIVFEGDDGADNFENRGDAITSVVFTGGADADIFENYGSQVNQLVFHGDSGIDAFEALPTGVTEIDFRGDADLLVNYGDAIASIVFNGDYGANVFQNLDPSTATIRVHGDADMFINFGNDIPLLQFNGDYSPGVFTSGSPSLNSISFEGAADTFVNYGDRFGRIVFNGDNGIDVLENTPGLMVVDVRGDDDVFVNYGDGYLTSSSLVFNGDGGDDVFQNFGSNISEIQFHGDDQADSLLNSGTNIGGITFVGGADDDAFSNSGANIGSIDFHGDDGHDRLRNAGSAVASILFRAGAGNDTLSNTGSNAGTLRMIGDSGADQLTNSGTGILLIDFQGDDGADALINSGDGIATITYIGGADGDVFENRGSQIGQIDFHGDDGSDSLVNSSEAMGIGAITFIAGADDDFLVFQGEASQVVFVGESGDDLAAVGGDASQVTLEGGVGDDRYVFVGDPVATVTIVESSADAGADGLVFSSYTGGGLDVNLSSTATQPQGLNANLKLQFSDPYALGDVTGSASADVIVGNPGPNHLYGASYQTVPRGQPASARSDAQWALLDFDTETGPGEHVYTVEERDAIESRINAFYQGPDALPWFQVRATQVASEIPSGLAYATLFFNKTPSFDRSGGESSALDFRNLDLGGEARIQVNGLLGGVDQPSATSENLVLLSAKIGAHELAHLMGVRHADAFGPVGYGLHTPPGIDTFKPPFPGPSGAFETFDHLIGSPASIGSNRFNDLGELFFGEREAIKLAFAGTDQGQVTAAEQSTAHDTLTLAQTLPLVPLAVPNSLGRGVHYGMEFQIDAFAVHSAAIDGDGVNPSESDFYRVTGRQGDLLTIEVLSIGLTRLGTTRDDIIDSIVRVYDVSGQLVSYYGTDAVNDDQFEPTDSILLDLLLPVDGDYFIEVDTFSRVGSSVCSPSDPGSPLNPDQIGKLTQDMIDRFLDTCNDTDRGSYELFIYRFNAVNITDATDVLVGAGGDDVLRYGPVPNNSPPVAVNDDILVGENGTVTFNVLADNGHGVDNDPDNNVVPSQTVVLVGPAAGLLIELGDGGYSYATGGAFDHLSSGQTAVETFTYRISDSFGETSTAVVTITIVGENDRPVPTIQGPATGVRGQERIFTISANDPDSADQVGQFAYRVNWGDGSPIQLVTGPFAVDVAHVFTEVGAYPVSAEVVDAHGAVGATSSLGVVITRWELQSDPLHPGMSILAVGGSIGDDVIKIREHEHGDYIKLKINEQDFDIRVRARIDRDDVDRILVFAQAGDDKIDVSDKINLTSMLFGGDGRDQIKGGGGDDILVGGRGDDVMLGGAGRDILIGGMGGDRIHGDQGDDILIAGWTVYDGNITALDAVLAEWTDSRDYAARVANLRGVGTGVRKNGDYFLNVATVFDDGVRDLLTGGGGTDWFLLNSDGHRDDRDSVTDLRNGESCDDIDPWW